VKVPVEIAALEFGRAFDCKDGSKERLLIELGAKPRQILGLDVHDLSLLNPFMRSITEGHIRDGIYLADQFNLGYQSAEHTCLDLQMLT